MIKRISAKNIKNCSFDHELAPVTVFYSRKNQAGKSARLDAIRLAVMGYHPDFSSSASPKTNRDNFSLIGGSRGEAWVEMESGERYGIVLEEKGGSIKASRHLMDPEMFDPKIGGMMIDPSSFFSMTGPERMNYLLSLTGDGERATMETCEKVFRTALPAGEDPEKAVAAKKEILQLAGPADGSSSLREWIDGFLEQVKERARQNRGYRQTLEKTLQGMTSVSRDEQEVRKASEIDREIDSLQEKARKLSEQLGREKEKEQAYLADSEKINGLEERLESMPEPDLARIEQLKKTAAQAPDREKMDELREKISGISEQTAPLNARKTAIEEKREILAEKIRQTGVSSEEAAAFSPEGEPEKPASELERECILEERRLAEARTKTARARNALDNAEAAANRSQKAVDSVESLGECPHCRSSSPGWKKYLLETSTEDLAEKKKHLEAAKKEWSQAEQEEEDAAEGLKTLQERLEKARETERIAEAAKMYAEQAKLNEEMRGLLSKLAELAGRHGDLSLEYDRLKDLQDLADRAAKELESMPSQEEYLKIKKQVEDFEIRSFDPEAIESMQKQIAEAERAVEALRQERKKAEKLDAERAQRADIEEKAAEAAVDLAVCKAIADTLEEMRGDLIRKAVDRILEPGNRIMSGIIPKVECRDGEFGLVENGIWVKTAAWNKAKKIMGYLVISCGLAAASPMKIALIDEFESIADETEVLLIDRLVWAVREGILSQAVIAVLIKGDREKIEGVPDEVLQIEAGASGESSAGRGRPRERETAARL